MSIVDDSKSFSILVGTFPEQSVIQGVVTNEETGVAIEGVSVRADTVATTTSGVNGAYSLQVPVGIYNIKFEKAGYNPATFTVDAHVPGTYTLNAALTEIVAPPTVDIKLLLVAALILSGAAASTYALRKKKG